MESRTVEPNDLDLANEEGVSDALREAVEEEMEYLEKRGLKLVRMRSKDDGEVFQITIHAGDEMYRMSEVAPGHVSRTVFRNPEKDDAMPYQDDGEEEEPSEEGEDAEETEEAADEEAEAEEEGENEDDGEDAEEEKETDGEEKKGEEEEEYRGETEDKSNEPASEDGESEKE